MVMAKALEILELSQDMGFVTASQDRTVIVRKMISRVSCHLLLPILFFPSFFLSPICIHAKSKFLDLLISINISGSLQYPIERYLYSEADSIKSIQNRHLDFCMETENLQRGRLLQTFAKDSFFIHREQVGHPLHSGSICISVRLT